MSHAEKNDLITCNQNNMLLNSLRMMELVMDFSYRAPTCLLDRANAVQSLQIYQSDSFTWELNSSSITE